MRQTRLLTLLGMGGLGKTRLSLQAAADVMDDYPDGVWFVELAPLTDARLVPQAVASVLGVKEEAGRPVHRGAGELRPRSALPAHPRQLRAPGAAPARSSPRSCCSRGRTSRSWRPAASRCTSPGETTYHVLPLARPDPRRRRSRPKRCRSYEAVRLFVDRATRGAAGLPDHARRTRRRSPQICHRLDGIPLALELAAARVRALSVEKIAERLSDRFRLLTGGNRTALPRQQTLRALIDWSYDLLDGFRAGAVAAARGVRRRLDAGSRGGRGRRRSDRRSRRCSTCSRIWSRNRWWCWKPRAGATGCSRPCASTRRSGWSSRAKATRRARAISTSTSRLPRRRGRSWSGPSQATWLARLDLGARESAGRACVVRRRGRRRRARTAARLGDAALLDRPRCSRARPSRDGGGARRARARSSATLRAAAPSSTPASSARWMGRYAEAQGYLQESLAIARELGDMPQCRRRRFNRLALAALGLGNVRRGAGVSGGGAGVGARGVGTSARSPPCSTRWRRFIAPQGELDAAEPLYENVLALARELGDREIIAIGLLNLAMVVDRPRVGRSRRRNAARSAWRSPRRSARGRRAERAGGLRRSCRVTRRVGARGALLRRGRGADRRDGPAPRSGGRRVSHAADREGAQAAGARSAFAAAESRRPRALATSRPWRRRAMARVACRDTRGDTGPARAAHEVLFAGFAWLFMT